MTTTRTLLSELIIEYIREGEGEAEREGRESTPRRRVRKREEERAASLWEGEDAGGVRGIWHVWLNLHTIGCYSSAAPPHTAAREQPRTIVDPVVGRLEGFQSLASARLEATGHNTSPRLYTVVSRYECNVPSMDWTRDDYRGTQRPSINFGVLWKGGCLPCSFYEPFIVTLQNLIPSEGEYRNSSYFSFM